MAEIHLRDVRKSYGTTQVIHGIDLDVADGELIVIVGPSGCGKSTLLRMVAGLERITSGEIHIGGRLVNDLEPRERDIAMVFQNYALYPHMTVRRNMAYGLRIAGKPKAEIAERIARAARMLELEPFLDRRPRQLSGGQRQRVAMGRAIVRDPAAFLFDEPLSNLDAKLRVQMRLEIKRLQRDLRTTALYVTHDQVEAMTLADRLVVMNEGVAEQVGRPLEVYARPASVFVAGFIGSPAMNFLDATVRDGRVEIDGLAPVEVETQAEGPVTLGIRPEDLSPGPEGLAVRVAMVEALGADTLIHGRIGGDGPLVTARLAGTGGIAEGDDVRLALRPGALHLFDRETGRRIADQARAPA